MQVHANIGEKNVISTCVLTEKSNILLCMFYIVKKLLHFLLRRKKKVKINCQKFIKKKKKVLKQIPLCGLPTDLKLHKAFKEGTLCQNQRLTQGRQVTLKIWFAGKLASWPSLKANYKIHLLNGPDVLPMLPTQQNCQKRKNILWDL